MSGTLNSKDFGFWRSLGNLSVGQVVLAWDIGVAVVIAAGGTVLMAHHVPDPKTHAALAGDLLLVGSALFGVIVAGFAIVAAFLGDRYSRLLEASGGSALRMLRHFLVVAGILVTSIVLSLALRVAAEPLARWSMASEQWALGVVIFMFLWGMFSVIELMKLILGVAVTNTQFRSVPAQGDENPGRRDKASG